MILVYYYIIVFFEIIYKKLFKHTMNYKKKFIIFFLVVTVIYYTYSLYDWIIKERAKYRKRELINSTKIDKEYIDMCVDGRMRLVDKKRLDNMLRDNQNRIYEDDGVNPVPRKQTIHEILRSDPNIICKPHDYDNNIYSMYEGVPDKESLSIIYGFFMMLFLGVVVFVYYS